MLHDETTYEKKTQNGINIFSLICHSSFKPSSSMVHTLYVLLYYFRLMLRFYSQTLLYCI